MIMRPWRPFGARSNGKRCKVASTGPKTGPAGNFSNSLKRLITGAGSTALWGINHLWTSNNRTTKNGKDQTQYIRVQKMGGRRGWLSGHPPRASFWSVNWESQMHFLTVQA